MRSGSKLLVGAALAAGLAVTAPAVAGASQRWSGHDGWGSPHAVFVQTDNLAGNQIVAFDRQPGGSLVQAGTYDTDGLGGQLNGSQVDFLASQGSLAFVPSANLLLAVNAGSNSISVFSVRGDQLSLRQVLPSGGSFPNSIAVAGDLVYVLNARNGGSLAGFRVHWWGLQAIPGSIRSLGLTTPTDATEFTHTPGQVAFSPSGAQLLVTTKATTSAIDVYGVHWDGRLSATPTVNVESGAVPFGLTFDSWGRVVVADAGTNAVSTYWLSWNGTLDPISTVATGEAATCWISEARGFFYASNAGSGSLSDFSEFHGSLSSPSTTTTDPGTVDSAVTPDGRYLYVQGGKNGTVDGFAVGATGSLTEISTVTVPNAVGGEGIVAL
jgi:6-phosphogluconolactonase (cycloisomerase 2 family)